jgi:putative membrane protein
MKKYIKEKVRFDQGLAIGVAFIIPGVSGGTMAVMLNLYDMIITPINTSQNTF